MHIIAVDDERLVLEDLEDICVSRPEVADFHAFNNPAEAIAYAKMHPVDVAFLDIEMPIMTGLDLAKNLNGIHPETCIIFVTGFKEYAFEAFGVNAVGYVLKPFSEEMIVAALEKAKKLLPNEPKNAKPFIHTFGYFDIFVDDKPVYFSSAKAKELMALLVDRHGGSISTENAVSELWPNREYDESVQSLFRKVLKSLRVSLADAGISDIFIDVRNQRSVDISKFTCDYYALLEKKDGAKEAYSGSYMQGYAWAKPTQQYIEKLLGGK